MARSKWVDTGVPGWTRDIIERWGERLNVYFNQEFGLEPDNLYGCGHYGCAFPSLSDPRWTLKLTRDPTEGPIVQYFTFSEDHFPAIINYSSKGVVHLEDIKWRKKEWPIYAYMRENVQPVEHYFGDTMWKLLSDKYNPDNAARFALEYHQVPNLLGDMQLAARELYKLKQSSRTPAYNLTQAENKWEAILSKMYSNQILYTIAETMGNAYRDQGIIFQDVHSGNVGYRIYDLTDLYYPEDLPAILELLIFDPGHTPIPEPVEIPQL